MTTAEQRAKKMDVKHGMLAERATVARERCEKLCLEYVPWLTMTGYEVEMQAGRGLKQNSSRPRVQAHLPRFSTPTLGTASQLACAGGMLCKRNPSQRATLGTRGVTAGLLRCPMLQPCTMGPANPK